MRSVGCVDINGLCRFNLDLRLRLLGLLLLIFCAVIPIVLRCKFSRNLVVEDGKFGFELLQLILLAPRFRDDGFEMGNIGFEFRCPFFILGDYAGYLHQSVVELQVTLAFITSHSRFHHRYSIVSVGCTLFFLSILVSTYLLLDKKHTILSSTVDLLDKIDYLCSLIFRKDMIFIWLDESDRHGEFYSNFYGGILISSKHHREVIERMRSIVTEVGINDEIKWQKVNEYHYEKYLRVVDELFDLAKEGKLKIRIFFRHNQFTASRLAPDEKKLIIRCFIISLLNLHLDYLTLMKNLIQ